MRRRYRRNFAVKSRWNKSWSIANIKSEFVATNCLWMLITPVPVPAERRCLVDTTARILAKIAILGLTVSLLRRNMGSVKHSVEGHTRPAVIAAKLRAMAICPVLFARNPAKSAAIIRNAPSCVMSLVYHVPRIVPGLAHIVDSVPCHVQYPVLCYHAQSAVQRFWLVGIDVRPCAERSVLMLRIVRFVRTPQSRK
jgi:hypothetical protein